MAATRRTNLQAGQPRGQMIQSVQRALAILKTLSNSGTKLGVTDLSHILHLSPSTICRLASTLEAEGLVEQDSETGKFSLGVGLLLLGSAAVEQREPVTLSRPWMEQLSTVTGENANLGVLYQGRAVCLGTVRKRVIGSSPMIGGLYPAHSTSIGKALLAWLPETELDEIIRDVGLPAFTEFTITDPAVLKNHLAQVRAQGYAIEDEETELGLKCVAAPIWSHLGTVVAAMSVSGHPSRLSDDNLESIKREVVSTTSAISHAMGYRPSRLDTSRMKP